MRLLRTQYLCCLSAIYPTSPWVSMNIYCYSGSNRSHTHAGVILTGRSGDKSRHVTNRRYTRLIITNVLKWSEITPGGNNFAVTKGGNQKRGEGESVWLGLKHVRVRATARSMSRSYGLRLLALLLRLVLARTDPLKFSANLDGIKTCGSGRKIKRFPAKTGRGARQEKNPEEAKPHQEEVKGDIFQRRTKVPFMGQKVEDRRLLREENMWLPATFRSPRFLTLK